MRKSDTITLRITPETKRRLDAVAKLERRTRSFLASDAIEWYLNYLESKTTSEQVDDKPTHSSIVLTPRQHEILKMLQRGMPNKIIAYELGLHESTVKVYIRQIMGKLNVSNRTQLALIAKSLNEGGNMLLNQTDSAKEKTEERDGSRSVTAPSS